MPTRAVVVVPDMRNGEDDRVVGRMNHDGRMMMMTSGDVDMTMPMAMTVAMMMVLSLGRDAADGNERNRCGSKCEEFGHRSLQVDDRLL